MISLSLFIVTKLLCLIPQDEIWSVFLNFHHTFVDFFEDLFGAHSEEDQISLSSTESDVSDIAPEDELFLNEGEPNQRVTPQDRPTAFARQLFRVNQVRALVGQEHNLLQRITAALAEAQRVETIELNIERAFERYRSINVGFDRLTEILNSRRR
jgi:hypothetical protein